MACGGARIVGIDDAAEPELDAKAAQHVSPSLSAHSMCGGADIAQQGPDGRGLARHRCRRKQAHQFDQCDWFAAGKVRTFLSNAVHVAMEMDSGLGSYKRGNESIFVGGCSWK
jgi:hypothetical protein